MAIGSPLGYTLPTPADSATNNTWGQTLNDFLTAVQDAVEGQVTPDAININGELDINGELLSNVGYLTMDQQSSSPSESNSAYVKSDGEWYVKDGSGNEIRLTDSGAIDVTSTGAIGGDYSTVAGAAVNYVDANEAYRFYFDTNQYAYLWASSLRLYDHSTVSPSSYIQILPPSGFSATSYGLRLPEALPSSGTELMTVTSAGVMDTTSDPSVTSITATTGTITTGTVTTLTSTTATATTANVTTLNVGSGSITTLEAGKNDDVTGRFYSQTGAAYLTAGSYNQAVDVVYSRVGDLVTVRFQGSIQYSASQSGNVGISFPLPYTAASGSWGWVGECEKEATAGGQFSVFEVFIPSDDLGYFWIGVGATEADDLAATIITVSNYTANDIHTMMGCFSYEAA